MNADDLACGLVICGCAIGIPVPEFLQGSFDFDTSGIGLITTDIEGWKSKLFVFILNILLTPFLLAAHSIRIYILPCLQVGFVHNVWNYLNSFFPECIKYTDKRFKAEGKSLGPERMSRKVEWKRLQDLEFEGKTLNVLFDGIEPSDIAQGALGDCWLLSAFASLSEKPYLIQNAFLTSTYNERGKYIIRLYDSKKKKFENITIDDFVPLGYDGKPMFQKLVSREMWPLLLEKAFAKMRGGYESIEGGLPLDAMQTITGYEGEHIWARGAERFDEKVYDKLEFLKRKNCILSCGSRGEDKTRELGRESVQGSIVGGHAYSILDVKTATFTGAKIRLIKLRNPWGTFEWKGDWSQDSPLWKKYTIGTFNFERDDRGDNGVFYMSWEDFVKYFFVIDVIYTDTSMHNMHYNAHEDHKCYGPIMGALLGLGKFWFLCFGFYNLWFTKSSGDVKREVQEYMNAKYPTEENIMVNV